MIEKVDTTIPIKTNEPDKVQSEVPKKRDYSVIGIGILVVLFLLIPTQVTISYQKMVDYQEPYMDEENYDIQVPYDFQEIYTERVPYDSIEYYQVSEPYTYNIPFDYTIVGANYNNYLVVPPTTMWVTVTNGDIKSGYFTVQYDVTTAGGATKTIWATEYILPLETKDIKATINDRITTYNYKVTSPQKEVTGVRDVQKTRSVTKYQDVQRTKTIIKYRTEAHKRNVTKIRTLQRYDTDYRQINVRMYERLFGLY